MIDKRIDYKKHCISEEEIKEKLINPPKLIDYIDEHVKAIIDKEFPNYEFYIGKTNNCEKRLQQHEQFEQKRIVEKMFVLVDHNMLNLISALETWFIGKYKEGYHPRGTNKNEGDPPLQYLYLIVWKNKI